MIKKPIAIALAGAMAVSMGIATFAATTTRFTGMRENLAYGYSGTGAVSTGTIDLGDIHADGEELFLPLTENMFVYADGTFPTSTNPITASQIRTSKIAVRTQLKGGSKVIKDVSLSTKNSRVEIKFVEEWISVREQDFEIFVYLTIDGKRTDDAGVTVVGTLANEEIEVYADYDYVDLSHGYVAVAEEFVPRIEVDLGNGVSIFTKFFKDKKYYGIASRDNDENALAVYTRYPDVDNVVILKTVGLNSTGDVVKLDTDYADYYVYDADMRYLGQSSEMLPFSTRYYLANKKLDIIDENEIEDNFPEEEEEEEFENNRNPGTGR